MRVVVVGAGPVGLFCALVQARAGHEVTVVERDAGPSSEQEWQRRGVMQFEHPHFLRHIVREALSAELPDVLAAVLAAGAVLAVVEGMPAEFAGLQCRRSVFERVLRAAAEAEPGLQIRVGHAEGMVEDSGRASGVVVDGATVPAELVLVASGRASRFADERRGAGEGGDCGFSYVSRMYQAHPDALWPAFPVLGALYDGFQAIVFPHDNRVLSALIIRRSTDRDLADLRHPTCFEAAAATIPVLAPWTAPHDWDPLTDVMVGGRLTNTYRGQRDEHGRVSLPGLVFVGDAVSTTNPAAGRGVAVGIAQARQLLSLLDEHRDVVDATEAFDLWCTDNVHPWYADHVARDARQLRRFEGEPLDLDGPLTSDVVVDAALVEPAMMSVVGPYLGMLALPASLEPLHEPVRELLRGGWRPAYAVGPTRDELVDTVRSAALVS